MHYIQTIDFTHREKIDKNAPTFNQVVGGSLMLEVYREYLDQRSAVGITSLPFDTEQTAAASVELLKTILLGAVNS